MGRIRTVAIIAAIVAPFVAAPSAQAAYAVVAKDNTANRSRTFHAYKADTGAIFDVAFRTTSSGEKRRLRAKLEVSQPSTTSDRLLVTRQAIRCSAVGNEDNFDQVYGVQNTLRGTTMTLTPRFTFTAGAPGNYHCWLWVNSGRPLPSSQRIESNVFKVGSPSYLEVTAAIHKGSGQSFEPRTASKLLLPGQSSQEQVLTWTSPTTSTFSISGDAYLTTCSVAGGSTDPITKKRLCEGHENPAGSTVRTKVIVRQLLDDGAGICKTSYFPDSTGREMFISKSVHHRLVYLGGSVTLRTGWRCSRNFKISLSVKVVSGAAVMVHKQGTLTAAVPPA